MAFCEECGAALAPEMRFCESCGAAVPSCDCKGAEQMPVSSPAPVGDINLFASDDWAKKWLSAASSVGNSELGILLTRTEALARQLGANGKELREVLSSYASSMRSRGICYHCLDLDRCSFCGGGGDVGSVIAALRMVVEVARPKYLFIIGNEEVVEVARWENRTSDSDGIVESDLCYATMDATSPWSGRRYDFDVAMRVGRLPSADGEGIDRFRRYLDNASRYVGTRSGQIPYGLSARVWEEESNDEYHAIAPGDVDVSPMVTKETVVEKIPADANLLFFNLHGSHKARCWYGQDGSSYPEAFEPEILKGWNSPYFIGVEACYGARYLGGIPVEESIVMTALRNNCMAFLGSSRIAFGSVRPQGTCADIVVGQYIKCLASGLSAGDAYVEGLKDLTRDVANMDDTDVKTLAEFSLYGDPAIRMKPHKGVCAAKSAKDESGVSKGVHISMPDVRFAVDLALAEVDAKIESLVDACFEREILPLFACDRAQVRQAVYRLSNSGLNQKMYSFEANGMPHVAKIYFDDRGAVKKTVVSK